MPGFSDENPDTVCIVKRMSIWDKSFVPEGLCTLDRIMSTISRVEHESPKNRLYLILVIIRMEDKKTINAIG